MTMDKSSGDFTSLALKGSNRFYLLQFVGWTMFTLLNLFARRYFVHFHVAELVNSLVLGICLFAVTSVLRPYYQSRFDLDNTLKCFGHVLLGSFVASAICLCLYALAVVPNQQFLFGRETDDILLQLLLGSPTILLLILMWSSVYLVFKKQFALKQAKNEQQKLSASLKEARLDILLSQLNPHFLFNAINNIRALTLEDSAKARDMLATLSEVMRYTMQIDKAPMISLQQELDVIGHYIDLNKLQFEDKLQVEYQIDEVTKSLELPPMILQLLVENAIKHGIGKLKTGGIIKISTEISTTRWQLKVENSGQLQPFQEQGSHVGLNNIRQRLAITYGEDATFTLEPSLLGVLAKIDLPLNQELT